MWPSLFAFNAGLTGVSWWMFVAHPSALGLGCAFATTAWAVVAFVRFVREAGQ